MKRIILPSRQTFAIGPNLQKHGFYIQGGARVGLQLCTWKIIQYSINNNTRINSVFPILTTINLLLPHSALSGLLCRTGLPQKRKWNIRGC